MAPALQVDSSLLFNYFYIYGRAGSLLLCTGSLVAASRGYSLLQRTGCSLWRLLFPSTGSKAGGFSSCSAWTAGPGLSSVAHGLSCSMAPGIFLDQGSDLCP